MDFLLNMFASTSFISARAILANKENSENIEDDCSAGQFKFLTP